MHKPHRQRSRHNRRRTDYRINRSPSSRFLRRAVPVVQVGLLPAALGDVEGVDFGGGFLSWRVVGQDPVELGDYEFVGGFALGFYVVAGV